MLGNRITGREEIPSMAFPSRNLLPLSFQNDWYRMGLRVILEYFVWGQSCNWCNQKGLWVHSPFRDRYGLFFCLFSSFFFLAFFDFHIKGFLKSYIILTAFHSIPFRLFKESFGFFREELLQGREADFSEEEVTEIALWWTAVQMEWVLSLFSELWVVTVVAPVTALNGFLFFLDGMAHTLSDAMVDTWAVSDDQGCNNLMIVPKNSLFLILC